MAISRRSFVSGVSAVVADGLFPDLAEAKDPNSGTYNTEVKHLRPYSMTCPVMPNAHLRADGSTQWDSYVLADFGNGKFQLYGFPGADARFGVDCDNKTSYEATSAARFAAIVRDAGKAPLRIYADLWDDTIQSHGPSWQAASNAATANGTTLGHRGDTVPEKVIQEAQRHSPHLAHAIRTMLAND